MPGVVKEIFFLSDELGRDKWTIPAEIYNVSRTLLSRSEYSSVFVPIRTLQFLAVITESEIVFVDSQAYAYSEEEGEGGRLIMVDWKFDHAQRRDSLNDPVPCSVGYYHTNSAEIQKRLVREFRDSLLLLDQRYRDRRLPGEGARILKLSKEKIIKLPR